MDQSFAEDESIAKIADALKYTPVSWLRDMLERQLASSMMEVCDLESDPAGDHLHGGASPAAKTSEAGSIFDQGSRMGILLEEDEEDYWAKDEGSSSWTRVILVPRTQKYHFAEGVSGHSKPTFGVELKKLRGLRITIYDGGGVVRSNWRKEDGAEDGKRAPWIGKCTSFTKLGMSRWRTNQWEHWRKCPQV